MKKILFVEDVEEMIRTLRHDVNNPLAGIISNAQLLQIQTQDESVLKRLECMEQLAFRISALLEGFSVMDSTDSSALEDATMIAASR